MLHELGMLPCQGLPTATMLTACENATLCSPQAIVVNHSRMGLSSLIKWKIWTMQKILNGKGPNPLRYHFYFWILKIRAVWWNIEGEGFYEGYHQCRSHTLLLGLSSLVDSASAPQACPQEKILKNSKNPIGKMNSISQVRKIQKIHFTRGSVEKPLTF